MRWLSSLLSTAGLLLVGGLILAVAGGLGGVRETVQGADGTGRVVTHWTRIALVAVAAVLCFVGAWAVRPK